MIDLSNGGQSLFVSYLCKFGTAADYTSCVFPAGHENAGQAIVENAGLSAQPWKDNFDGTYSISLLIKAPVLIELDVKIGSDEYGEAISQFVDNKLVIDVRHGPISEESVAVDFPTSLIAGEEEEFTLDPLDSQGNQATNKKEVPSASGIVFTSTPASSSFTDSIVITPLDTQEPYDIKIKFTAPQVAGSYTFKIYVNTNELAVSKTIVVKASTYIATSSTTVDYGTRRVGTQKIIVSIKDIYSNPTCVTRDNFNWAWGVTGGELSEPGTFTSCISAGKHLVSIPSVNTVGTYTFTAKISNLLNVDTDQPFDRETLSTSTSINVVSDVPSTKSTMTTPSEYIEVGQPAYFYVIAIDRLGNSIAVSGQSSAFSVTVTGSISGTRAAEVSNSLSDRTGSVGSYYGSFTPLYAETYTLTVSVDGYPLDQGSSTHIASVFLTNEADYFKVTGAPVSGVVGSSLTFIINQWNLEYNLDMNTISTTFLSKLSRPQSQVSLTLSPLGTGAGDADMNRRLYVDKLYTTKSGTYTLSVSKADADTPSVYHAVKDSPVSFTLAAAKASGSVSTITKPSTPAGGYAPGATLSLPLSLKDSYGNAITTARFSDDVIVQIKSKNTARIQTLTIKADSTGTGLVAEGVLKFASDQYSVLAYASGVALTMVNPEIIITTNNVVAPALVDGTASFAASAGLPAQGSSAAFVAGTEYSLYIFPADVYGNVAVSDVLMVVVLRANNIVLSQGVWNTNTGGYKVSYTFTTAGTTPVTVSVTPAGATAATVRSFTAVVSPGAVVGSTTKLISITNATSVTRGTWVVRLYDRYGNALTSSPAGSVDVKAEMILQSTTKSSTLFGSLPVVSNSADAISITLGSDGTQIGLVTLQYLGTITGTYTLKLYVDGVAATDVSSYKAYITSGPIVATTSTASGTGWNSAKAGVKSSFVVVPRDKYSNRVYTSPASASSSLVVSRGLGVTKDLVTETAPSFVFDTALGQYNVSYTPSVAGTSSLSFKINGANIADSPRVFTVTAGAASASKSFLSGAGVRGTLFGAASEVVIQAVDSFGNLKTSGGDTFRASLNQTGSTTTVTDNSDGTYTITYTPVAAGAALLKIEYGTGFVQIGCDFITIPSSGCLLDIKTADSVQTLDPLQTTYKAAYLSTSDGDLTLGFASVASTGKPSGSFRILTFDQDGVQMGRNDVTIQLSIGGTVLSGSDIAITAVEGTTGEFRIDYYYSTAGTWPISITANGVEIGARLREIAFDEAGASTDLVAEFGGYSNLVIRPDFTTASSVDVVIASGVQGTNPIVATAGFPVEFAISAKDSYGNVQYYSSDYPGDVFTVTATASQAETLNAEFTSLACFPSSSFFPDCRIPSNYVEAFPDGSVSAEASLTFSNTAAYTISVSLQPRFAMGISTTEGSAPVSDAVQVKQFKVTVVPGVVNAANSLMNGDGLSGSIADERKSVLISAYDAGSNALYKLSEDEREDALTSCRIDFVGTSEGNMGEKFSSSSENCFALDGCFGLTTDQCLFEVFYNITYLTGTFDMSVRLCASGSPDDLEVNPDGCLVSGESVSITVTAGSPNSKTSGLLATPPSTVTAMESGTLKFVARDEFNNEITIGGDGNPLVVSAIQTKPTAGSLLTNVATLSDNEDGTYNIVYTLPTGGNGVEYQFNITYDGDHIIGSPYTMSVASPNISPMYSFAYGEALSDATMTARAGEVTSFTIQPVDASGNTITKMPDTNKFKVVSRNLELSAGGGQEPSFTTNPDGSIKVSFTAVVTSPAQLTISAIRPVDGVSTETVIDSPANGIIYVNVDPGVAVASSSYTRNDRTVPLTQVAVAGSEHNYQIITADKYSNQLTYDPYGTPTNLTFAAPNKYGPEGYKYVSGPAPAKYGYAQEIGASEPGNWRVRWSAETTGTYALRAYISDGLVLDGPGGSQLPLNMEVIASDADYSKFTLTGAGITASATVNSKATLTLEARDVYGNFKKDRGNLVNDIIDGISQTIYSDDALLMEESTIQEHSVTFDSATGKYTIEYTPSVIGYMETALNIRGVDIANSPFQQEIVAGAISASYTRASGPGIVGGSLGIQTYIAIDPRDASDFLVTAGTSASSFEVTVTTTAGSIIQSGPTWDESSRVYRFEYMIEGSTDATVTVDIAYDSEAIAGSPFSNIPISSSVSTDVDEKRCVISGPGITYGVAGELTAIAITLYDSDGILAVPSAAPSLVLTVFNGNNENFVEYTDFQLFDSSVLSGLGLDPSAFGYVNEDAGGTYFVTFTKTSVAEAPYKLTVAVNGLVTGSVEYENPGEFTFELVSSVTSSSTSYVQLGNTDGSIVAGDSVPVYIYPRDAYYNGQDYKNLANKEETFSIALTGPAAYTVTYTGSASDGTMKLVKDTENDSYYYYGFIKPVKAGVYRGTAQLVQNGVTSSVLTLAQAALSLDVSAGALDISNSVVGGQGVFSSKVLAKGAVKVQFRDSVSNLLTDDIVQSSLSAVKFNLMRRDVNEAAFASDIELVYVSAQSAFVGEYISTVAGTLDMQVSACDSSDPPVCEEVPISGYTGTVISPGSFVSAMAEVVGADSTSEFKVAEDSLVYVFGRDSQGNTLSTGGEILSAKLVPTLTTGQSELRISPSNIVDNGDGMYTITVQPKQSGDFKLLITRSGAVVGTTDETGFLITVEPGVASTASTVSGTGFGLQSTGYIVAGNEAKLTLIARDAIGNAIVSSADEFTYEISAGGSVVDFGQFAYVEESDGTYEATYTIEKSGDLIVEVKLRGESLLSVPSGGKVLHSSVSLKDCLLYGDALTAGVEAGVLSTLSLIAKDQYGNVVTDLQNSGLFELKVDTLNNPGFLPFEISDASIGLLTVDFTLPSVDVAPGLVTVVYDNDLALNLYKNYDTKEQFSIQVYVGQPSASTTTLVGISPTIPFQTDVASTVELYVRDANGNVIGESDELTAVLDSLALNVFTVRGQTYAVDITFTSSNAVNGDYITILNFSPPAAGSLRLSLYIDGSEVIDPTTEKDYECTVLPGAIGAPYSTYSGAGIFSGAIAGSESTIYIQAADRTGGIITTDKSTDTTAFTLEFEILSNSGISNATDKASAISGVEVIGPTYTGAGTYMFKYIPYDLGYPYSMYAKIATGNDPIGTSDGLSGGETVQVYDVASTRESSAEKSAALLAIDSDGTLMLGSQIPVAGSIFFETVAGEAIVFFIQERDVNGLDVASNSATAPSVQVSSGFVPTAPTVVNDGSGIWRVTVKPEKSGEVPIFVAFDGVEIANSQMILTVIPAATSALTSTIEGTGLEPDETNLVRAGLSSKFSIIARDAFGNYAEYDDVAGNDEFHVEIASSVESETIVVEGIITKIDGNGYEYEVEFVPRYVGTNTVSVYLGPVGGKLLVTTASVEVTNGVVNVQATEASVTTEELSGTTVSAGDRFEFSIYAKDIYGYDHATPALLWDVELIPSDALKATGATSRTGTVTGYSGTKESGGYSVTFTLYKEGTWYLSLTERDESGGSMVSSMYVPITVVGGTANVYKTTLSGGIASGLVATSTDRTVYITTRDVYGNLAFSSGLHPFSADDELNDFEITIDLDEIVPEGAEIQGYEYTNNGAEYVSPGVFKFTYSTILPGTYYIQIIQKKEAIGDGSNKVITVKPVPAPVVTEVRFANSLSTIQVVFDVETDEAMQIGASDCSNVLATATISLLGTNPLCKWTNIPTDDGAGSKTHNYLQITLGSNPTVKPQTSQNAASFITLKQQTIRTKDRNSYFAVASTGVLGPLIYPSVKASITGVVSVGTCTPLNFDALRSTGGGGRALTYVWRITSTQDVSNIDICEVDTANKINTCTDSLFVPYTDLVPGGTYTAELQVTNFLGTTSTATFDTAVAAVPLPKIATPEEVTIYASDRLTIISYVSAPDTSCMDYPENLNALEYYWEFTAGSLQVESSDWINTRGTPELTLPPNSFEPGETYELLVTATIASSGNTAQAITSTTKVNVAYREIIVEDRLGGDRIVSPFLTNSLVASPFDPEDSRDESGVAYPWSYYWFCTKACEIPDGESTCELVEIADGADCFTDASAMFATDTDTISIPGSDLLQYLGTNNMYEIGCTISKGVRGQSSLTGRTKTAYVTWTSITSVSVTIGDDDEDYFQGEWSPTRGGTLTCESPSATAAVASGESVTYQWELVSGSVGFAGGSLESLVSTSYGVEPSEAVKQSSLTLAPNTLLAGSEYTFKCTVILEASGTTGEASQTITVGTPPSGGFLEVRYNEMTSTILCPSAIDGCECGEDSYKSVPAAENVVDDATQQEVLLVDYGFEDGQTEFELVAKQWLDGTTDCSTSCLYQFAYALRGQESEETAISGKETTNTKISGFSLPSAGDGVNTADIILIVYVYDEQGMATRYATDYYLRINPLAAAIVDEDTTQQVSCNLVRKLTEDAEQTSTAAIFGDSTSSSSSTRRRMLAENWRSIAMSGTKAERRAKFDAESIKIIQRISNTEITDAKDPARTAKGRKVRASGRSWYAASSEVAQTLINTDFNAYVGAKDTARALSFINVWGKTWGVPPATISDQPTPALACNSVETEFLAMKNQLVQEYSPLDLASSVDDDYLEKYICSMNTILWKPGEISNEAFDVLFSSGATSKIKGAVFQHRLYVDGALNVDLQLTDAAKVCAAEFLSNMLVQAYVGCHNSPIIRDQDKMNDVITATTWLGQAIADTLVPGEDPESVEAFYFTVTGFAGQRRSPTQILRNERSTDLMLTVPQITSDVTDVSGPLLSMNIDIDDDGPCFSELAGFTCGKNVTSDDIIRVSSTVFTKTTYSLSAMDTINPFSAKVLIDGGEEQYGYTAIVVPQFVKSGNGHFAEQIKAFNSPDKGSLNLGEDALTAMIASTPTAMLDYAIATDNFAYAARIPSNASYFDFTMHKSWDQIFDGQSKDREDYQTEIRQWPLGDDGFGDFVTEWSDLPRKWSPDNFNVTDSTSIRGFSTSLYSALTFGPYFVETVYYPPPPTIYSPPPPAPPLSPRCQSMWNMSRVTWIDRL